MCTTPQKSQPMKPVELEAAELDDGSAAADGREIALVPVAERRDIGRARDPGGDQPADIAAHLLGGRRDARHGPAVGAATAAVSPITNTSGWPGTDRSAPTVTRPARSCCGAEPLRGRRGHDAGGPDDGRGVDASALEYRRRARSQPVTRVAVMTSTPLAVERAPSIVRQVLGKASA